MAEPARMVPGSGTARPREVPAQGRRPPRDPRTRGAHGGRGPHQRHDKAWHAREAFPSRTRTSAGRGGATRWKRRSSSTRGQHEPAADEPSHRAGRRDPSSVLGMWALIAAFGAGFCAWAGLQLDHKLAGTNPDLPLGPTAIVSGMKRGTVEWTPLATVLAAIVLVVLVALCVAVWRLFKPSGKNRTVRTARPATWPEQGPRGPHREEGPREGARLGVPDCPASHSARTALRGKLLYASWEGRHDRHRRSPRREDHLPGGPAIIAAPGASSRRRTSTTT